MIVWFSKATLMYLPRQPTQSMRRVAQCEIVTRHSHICVYLYLYYDLTNHTHKTKHLHHTNMCSHTTQNTSHNTHTHTHAFATAVHVHGTPPKEKELHPATERWPGLSPPATGGEAHRQQLVRQLRGALLRLGGGGVEETHPQPSRLTETHPITKEQNFWWNGHAR